MMSTGVQAVQVAVHHVGYPRQRLPVFGFQTLKPVSYTHLPKKAAEHFREALRLDPQNDWARRGIIEALKARHFIYALMLKYFLWMARFSRGGQMGILLAAYFGNRILAGVAHANPNLAPWILPLRILYVAFALMTWLAYPLFNLCLLYTSRCV